MLVTRLTPQLPRMACPCAWLAPAMHLHTSSSRLLPAAPCQSTGPRWLAERQHSKRAKKWADEQLVVLTGIPTEACNTPWGDHLISLGVQNKQDWARLHGHELHLMASSTDLRIRPGAWQKVALLRKVRAGPPAVPHCQLAAILVCCLEAMCPPRRTLRCAGLLVWAGKTCSSNRQCRCRQLCQVCACDIGSTRAPTLALAGVGL